MSIEGRLWLPITSGPWPRWYLASSRASEWAARARRALKFCEIQSTHFPVALSRKRIPIKRHKSRPHPLGSIALLR